MTMLTPLLKLCEDKKEHSYREATEHLSSVFKLSNDDRRELLPSSVMSVFGNRVGWAQTRLKHSGLIESTRRGYFRITERGSTALLQKVTLDDKFLRQYPEYLEFVHPTKKDGDDSKIDNTLDTDKTPEEIFEDSYQTITHTLMKEVLEEVKSSTSFFFERMVIELLVRMGNGGSIKEAGKAIGKSGDEGIDGIIKEDVLGLDVIYVQVKKWDGVVGRPEIHKFAGALQGQRAKKGIFITTGTFSREARDYTSSIDTKIVLIDGNELSRLMVLHNIGVSTIKTYETKFSLNNTYIFC
jgi:restriction system protein